MTAVSLPNRQMGVLSPHEAVAGKTVEKYLSKRAEGGPWSLPGPLPESPDLVVVVPVLAEEKRLPKTLVSLLADSAETLARTLVLVVVNNPPADRTPPRMLEENRKTRAGLEEYRTGNPPDSLRALYESPMTLSYVDASSPGRELPLAAAGVGLARKIGMDLALGLFPAETAGRRILICLDGDTTVAPGALSAIRRAFRQCRAGALSLRFEHPLPGSARHRRAMAAYEIYLRHWVLGLRRGGSPYAFHTIGSAMAVRADAYAAVGGMRRRKTTEDFYFLQNLAKTAGVKPFDETCVYPSARLSRRVPVIGTGRSLARMVENGIDHFRLTHPKVFDLLGQWLRILDESVDSGPDRAVLRGAALHPVIGEVLESARFQTVWSRIEGNAADRGSFVAQLHRWFDGLKTLRLVHALSHRAVPPLPLVKSASRLLSDSVWATTETRPEAPDATSAPVFDLLARYRAADRTGPLVDARVEDRETGVYNGRNS